MGEQEGAIVNAGVENGPLGGLPVADPTLLQNAPLEVAIVDVRFAGVEAISSDVATAVREALNEATGMQFPHIKPAQQRMVQIELGPDGSQLSNKEGLTGWQVLAADGSFMLTVMPDNVIMQTTNYNRWSDSIGQPLSAVLEILAKTIKPTLRTRVGLRYVDRFRDQAASEPEAWRGRLRDEILGPLGSEVFGGRIRGAQQQLELFIDDNHRSILRHGFTTEEDQSVGYLLDIDVFNELSIPFDVDDIVANAVQLNRTALSLFQSCLNTDYLRSLQEEGTR